MFGKNHTMEIWRYAFVFIMNHLIHSLAIINVFDHNVAFVEFVGTKTPLQYFQQPHFVVCIIVLGLEKIRCQKAAILFQERPLGFAGRNEQLNWIRRKFVHKVVIFKLN
jgi:hypothetical protein